MILAPSIFIDSCNIAKCSVSLGQIDYELPNWPQQTMMTQTINIHQSP